MNTILIENPNLFSGLPPSSYYAPNFKVLVEGLPLDPFTHGDILDLKVTMDIKDLSSFELTVNNWDDGSFDFKYSDKKTFDIGNRVDIQMGYADDLRFMMSGIIKTLAPSFPESGPPTMRVTGVDRRLKLQDRKPTPKDIKKFVNKTDWEIAQIIAQRNELEENVTKEIKEKHSIVVQKNQDDLTFLMERAKRIDYDFYIRVDPQSGKDTLFFVKPTDNRDARRSRVFVFEWGKNLMSYSTQLTLNQQVSSVTVRGWDPATKRQITYTAKESDLPNFGGGGTNGPQEAKKKLANRQDFVVDQPVTSDQEARELAISLLRERAYQFLTGSGKAIGLPNMRPGDGVELLGLGKRFSGERENPLKYYVQKVTHTLGPSGYLTEFDVRSTKDGGTISEETGGNG